MKTLRKIFLISCAAAALYAPPSRAAEPRRPGPGRLSPLADSLRPERRAPAQSALKAFNAFSAANRGGWNIRFNPRTALPEALTGGRTARRYAGAPEQAAAAFIDENAGLLGVDRSGLRLENKKEFLGVTHLQYRQYYKELPIEFSYVRTHVTASGEIAGYQAKYEPSPDLEVTPSVPALQAELAAAADLGVRLTGGKTELVIFPDEQAGELRLAWKVRGRGTGGLWVYYVDALTGAILLRYDDLRRYCTLPYNTMGSSSGTIYEISPIPSGASDYQAQSFWEKPVVKALSDQYFWVASHSNTPAVTDLKGDYCSATDGKVFSAFKGPYFSVSNARGASAHYDNGGGVWRDYYHPTPTETPNPYLNSRTYPYSVTVAPVINAGESLAKVMPRFDTFRVGEIDEYGSTNDSDEVVIKNPSLAGNNAVGSYVGKHTRQFFGAAVEDDDYQLELVTDESGTDSGFRITVSSCLVLTNSPGVSAAPSAVVWSTSNAAVYLDTSLGPVSGLDEVNAFYHLNKMRRFFDSMNSQAAGGAKPVDLTARVPVMVHASGLPDASPYRGMINAFYDLDKDNIFFGDGPDDYGYRSLALDGTIVRHEYTHLVVHRIYPIINFGEFGAISEALSDYFAMASFWSEGYVENPVGHNNNSKKNLAELGNFLGDAYARPISGTDRVMPGSWQGELYNDSGVLSQALYSLRRGGTKDIGTISGGTFNGLPVSDFLVWSSLFYFPDSFLNFFEAMKDACTQLNYITPGQCPAVAVSSITAAFAAHGIASPGVGDQYVYETGTNSGMCRNNNGPECAAEINFAGALSAALYPAGDADYYALPLNAGSLQVTLTLPPGSTPNTYKAYALYLFDSDRNPIAEAVPVLNEWLGYCGAADCGTLYPTVTLSASVAAGRYYLLVAGGPTETYGNSGVNSVNPYTLALAYVPGGTVAATLNAGSTADNDLISYTFRYNSFAMVASPSSSTLTAAEQVFSYAVLRDHNNVRLEDTRTNLAGSLLQTEGALTAVTDTAGRPVISGSVRVKPGFAARYPGVGTVSLEIFGRNHMGAVVSLGFSGKFNLKAGSSGLTAYNNLLGAPGARAVIKYELASAGNLSIKVYTQAGTLVKTLYDGPASGKGAVDWDGTNSSGSKAASGIYIVRASGPGLNKADKVAIVR